MKVIQALDMFEPKPSLAPASVVSSLFGWGCSIVYSGGRSVGLPLCFCRGRSQVVVGFSAAAPSLLSSITAPPDFSSTSGVLGGAAFGLKPPITSV